MFPQQPTAEQARTAVEQIFEDERYQEIAADGGMIGDLATSAFDLWFRFQAWISNLSQGSPTLYWLIVAALTVILCLLLFHIVWIFRKAFQKTAEQDGFSTASSGASLEGELRQDLAIALQNGAYTEALSLHFRIGLICMARRHPERLRPGMTNRECLNAWNDQPELRGRLVTVVDLLDFKWYAREECGTKEYHHAEKILEEMR